MDMRESFPDFSPLLLEQVARSADPDSSLIHFDTFLDSVPSASNLVYFLKEHPLALEVLCQILGASPYLTQLLVRSPEYFYWLMEGDRLQRIAPADYFVLQARDALHNLEDPQRALDALRRLRRRELLRIAAQDVLGIGDLAGTVKQISDLADALLEQVYVLVCAQESLGPRGFAVLALGKLGGEELNYSSDIDLLYVYEDECAQDAMLRLARRFTRALTTYTNEGHLYRVDLRLRPMGKTGEMAYSLAACRQYYETWADTFDRLALLKIRPVAGDLTLGRRFVASIQEFVFKKYLDTAAIEEIRWLKRRTDRALARRRAGRNIKLGTGGIREIEFFVQAFQLLYGGSQPGIRTTNTLQALEVLRDSGYVAREDYTTLREAYVFLRNLEHKLQLVHDRQTHTLPQDESELARCARRMGYRGAGGKSPSEEFNQQLERHRKAVRHVFESLFEPESSQTTTEELVLNPELTGEEARAELALLGVPQAEQVYEGLKMLEQAPSFPHSPSRTRNLLANLAPRLIEHSRTLEEPRLLFNRLDRFCESLGSRANLYAELVENADLARRLLRLLSSGEFLSETLIRNPELLDAVWNVPGSPSRREELQRLAKRETAAGRDVRNAVRLFKQREEFKIALQDLLAAQPATVGFPDTRERLTQLAEICIESACARALERFFLLAEENFTFFGLGKLGGRELTYHSDLDLVFVYKDPPLRVQAHQFEAFLKEFHDELELYTAAGRAYRLDFRLRPEGRHGPLAVPSSVLPRYFQGRAQPWERIAYVKLRPIVTRGEAVWDDTLIYGPPFREAEIAELDRIRRRKELEIGQEGSSGHHNFKVGCGGLMDIQFIVQSLQIQHRVCEVNTQKALKGLIGRHCLDRETGRTLQQGLEFLFALEAMQRLLEEKSADLFPAHPAANRRLAGFLGFSSGEQLAERYLAATGKIRRVYETFFRGARPAKL